MASPLRPVFGWVLCLLFIACSNQDKQQETVTPSENNFKIAHELILGNEEEVDKLKDILLDSTNLEVYHWKNHIFLWGWPEDTTGISRYARQLSIDFKAKSYSDPFYAFDPEIHCADVQKSAKWKNYLLTANLVKDPSMQQEYMDYHKTQFQEWPEVRQGFCNAEFQQLLLFRNGRQLLLVISVPAGMTLDELNPKTTKNNPRVDEWNALMSKYQEGIPGTGEEEVWVFLEAF